MNGCDAEVDDAIEQGKLKNICHIPLKGAMLLGLGRKQGCGWGDGGQGSKAGPSWFPPGLRGWGGWWLGGRG